MHIYMYINIYIYIYIYLYIYIFFSRHRNMHRIVHKYADPQIQTNHCAHARTQAYAQRSVCNCPYLQVTSRKMRPEGIEPGEKACVNATAHSVP